ncbi:MAG: polyprenyl diphosphate synthase [Dehalococcoidia bacterium]
MQKATAVAELHSSQSSISPLPNHVAIIMDGNGRWAQSRGLTRLEGHSAGTENIRNVIKIFANHGIKYLTLYAFSTENWTRPSEEIQGLFHILEEVIEREVQNLHNENIKLSHVGDLDGLSEGLQKKIGDGIALTRNNTRMTLNLAFNYGGRSEILSAVRRIIEDGLTVDDISEVTFNRYLLTNELPDPDLIIRTAGEMRLSNFLIWQAAYSEYYSTPTPWPDFGEDDVMQALLEYSRRERRFGGVGSNK